MRHNHLCLLRFRIRISDRDLNASDSVPAFLSLSISSGSFSLSACPFVQHWQAQWLSLPVSLSLSLSHCAFCASDARERAIVLSLSIHGFRVALSISILSLFPFASCLIPVSGPTPCIHLTFTILCVHSLFSQFVPENPRPVSPTFTQGTMVLWLMYNKTINP